jgi:hypothetical protein
MRVSICTFVLGNAALLACSSLLWADNSQLDSCQYLHFCARKCGFTCLQLPAVGRQLYARALQASQRLLLLFLQRPQHLAFRVVPVIILRGLISRSYRDLVRRIQSCLFFCLPVVILLLRCGERACSMLELLLCVCLELLDLCGLDRARLRNARNGLVFRDKPRHRL